MATLLKTMELPEYVDIEITDQYIFDTTMTEIDDTIEQLTKLPWFTRLLIGEELNRSIQRLQVMTVILKNLNIRL